MAALHAYEADGLKSAVASLEAGPALRKVRTLTDPSTVVDTDLDDVLSGFTELRGGVRPPRLSPRSVPARSPQSSC